MVFTPREQPARVRRSLRCALASVLALFAVGSAADPASLPSSSGFDLYVSPLGDDASRGDHWSHPLRSIQRALELAEPGQQVGIAAGQYFEDPRSVRDGRADSPIRLVGAAGAVIKGAGDARVFEIRHSHLELVNLTIDGAVREADGSTRYRDKLVYVVGQSREHGVTGVRLLNLRLLNAGGECVRLKYFAHHNEVAWSRIAGCGIDDFHGDGGAKNGEGVYIGTAPEQLSRNPTSDLDASNGNWIHHNEFDTRGNECVDIKEASRFNLVEHNSCTGQLDEDAAGISTRGNDNVIRFNLVTGNRGAGVRFGGDTEHDGIDNHAYGNVLLDNAFAAFKVMAGPQSRLCGNHVRGASPVVRGRFARGLDPTAPCP